MEWWPEASLLWLLSFGFLRVFVPIALWCVFLPLLIANLVLGEDLICCYRIFMYQQVLLRNNRASAAYLNMEWIPVLPTFPRKYYTQVPNTLNDPNHGTCGPPMINGGGNSHKGKSQYPTISCPAPTSPVPTRTDCFEAPQASKGRWRSLLVKARRVHQLIHGWINQINGSSLMNYWSTTIPHHQHGGLLCQHCGNVWDRNSQLSPNVRV